MNIDRDYKMILEAIAGLMIIDKNGDVVYINDQCADYLKIDRDKVVGRNIKNAFAPSTMEALLKGDVPANVTFYFEDGRMSVSEQVQLRQNGEIVGVMEYDVVQDLDGLDDLLEKYAHSLKDEIAYYRERVRKFESTKYSIDNIIGSSEKMCELRKKIELAATLNSTVLITGETGTGKELIAHAVHNLSLRAFGEFVKINSAGMPESLVESELFGYEEGAFTGAKKGGKKGKFEIADKGTLFIDEVNQMPMSLQPKLLRALQEGEIDPIGSERAIDVDVRIIAAGNQDLKEMVASGDFRADLFYRLNVFPIEVPPLRERLEDLPELVEGKIKELNPQMGKNITFVDEDVYKIMRRHDWPGNVRELYNVVERAMTFAKSDTITIEDINFLRSRYSDEMEDSGFEENGRNLIAKVKNDAERKLIINVLRHFGGNKTKTAAYLDIARPLLYQKMKRLGIKNNEGGGYKRKKICCGMNTLSVYNYHVS